MVLQYGAPLCAGSSLDFYATQWWATVGSGTAITVRGQIILRAAYGVTITIS